MCSLGSCTNSSRRSQTEEENKRLNEATRTVGLLSSIGLSFQQFHEAVAAFASSKAAYGWFTRVPTKGASDRFWSTLRRGDRRCRMANKFIRSYLLGGNTHLGILTYKNLAVTILGSCNRLAGRWTAIQGHPVTLLRNLMKNYGWVEIGPWKWKHDLGDMTINAVTQIRDLPQLAHKLRNSWRIFQWEQFLNSNRHETADFIDTPLKDICKIDLNRTRSWLFSSAEARTIALGSVVSPAWYDGGSSNSNCFFCHAHLGDWKHICWFCSERPSLHACPDSAFTTRFGWVLLNDGNLNHIHSWMESVVRKMWDLRYPKDTDLSASSAI